MLYGIGFWDSCSPCVCVPVSVCVLKSGQVTPGTRYLSVVRPNYICSGSMDKQISWAQRSDARRAALERRGDGHQTYTHYRCQIRQKTHIQPLGYKAVKLNIYLTIVEAYFKCFKSSLSYLKAKNATYQLTILYEIVEFYWPQISNWII